MLRDQISVILNLGTARAVGLNKIVKERKDIGNKALLRDGIKLGLVLWQDTSIKYRAQFWILLTQANHASRDDPSQSRLVDTLDNGWDLRHSTTKRGTCDTKLRRISRFGALMVWGDHHPPLFESRFDQQKLRLGNNGPKGPTSCRRKLERIRRSTADVCGIFGNLVRQDFGIIGFVGDQHGENSGGGLVKVVVGSVENLPGVL
ncbi:hypothetical protein HG530_010450 [Fusarium avenaceum]|nr:hypothetical protein HG530_010450 [Fusarium avenaceum]